MKQEFSMDTFILGFFMFSSFNELAPWYLLLLGNVVWTQQHHAPYKHLKKCHKTDLVLSDQQASNH